MEARNILSPQEIIDIKDNTIRRLSAALLDLKRKRVASKEVIEKNIAGHFQQAFENIKKEQQRTQLYRKLSLAVHPDKIKDNFDEPIIAYLGELALLDTPQKILDQFKEKKNIFQEIRIAPVNWAMRVFGHIVKIYVLKQKTRENPDVDIYKEQLAEEKRKLKEIAPGVSLIFRLLENPSRYFQPLKFLVYLTVILTGIALSIGIFLSTLSVTLVSYVTRGCVDLLVNLFTLGNYFRKCKAYKQEKFPEARAEYLRKLKDMWAETADMSDEDVIFFLTANTRNPVRRHSEGYLYVVSEKKMEEEQKAAEEEYINKPARESIVIKGMAQLKLIAASFKESFSQPLPEGFLNKIAAFFRPLCFLIAIPLFVLAIAVEGVHYLLSTLVVGVVAIAFLGWTVSLFALNTPLFIWDALNSLKNSCCSSPASDHKEKAFDFSSEQTRNQNPSRMQPRRSQDFSQQDSEQRRQQSSESTYTTLLRSEGEGSLVESNSSQRRGSISPTTSANSSPLLLLPTAQKEVIAELGSVKIEGPFANNLSSTTSAENLPSLSPADQADQEEISVNVSFTEAESTGDVVRLSLFSSKGARSPSSLSPTEQEGAATAGIRDVEAIVEETDRTEIPSSEQRKDERKLFPSPIH